MRKIVEKEEKRENTVTSVTAFHAGGTFPNVTPSRKKPTSSSLAIVGTSQRTKNLVIFSSWKQGKHWKLPAIAIV